MKIFDWGTIYLVKAGWDGDHARGVVDRELDQISNFGKARELWELAGNPRRSAIIREILERAYGRDPVVMDETDITDMIEALDGFEHAMIGTVVDDAWNVVPSRRSELRARVRTVDMEDGGGRVPTRAVAIAIANVVALRNLLVEARARGLHVHLSDEQ